jgi:DNA-binding winged helix-turn-helix (wHTH) protein/Tfp pilus assembly protein PilF
VQQLRLQDRLVFPELNIISTRSVRVHVEPKVMAVLLELVKHQGEVVSKTHLMESVWGGVFICEEVVTNAISILRRALVDDAKRPILIQTISKGGYRLILPAVQEDAGPNTAESPSGRTPYDSLQSIDHSVVVDSVAQPNDLTGAILRARYLRHEETVASLTAACSYCEEIIRQEPNCAAAYAELALTLFQMQKLGAVRQEDGEPKVRAAVDRALCLDERASMSLVCLAKLEYRYEWRWDRAELAFQKAIRANSFEADAFTEFSILLSAMRRFDQGLEHARRACSLDPFSPPARLQAGHANYATGSWAAAGVHYERLLRFTPQHLFARWGLAESLIRRGKLDEATATIRDGVDKRGDEPHPMLAISLLRAREHIGSQASTSIAWDQLHEQTKDPILRSELYISAGEMTKAFVQLNDAADLKHYRLAAVNLFPQYEPLRHDRRYRRLLNRMRLRG